MRFLFTSLAGLGHFHPLVPAARALEAEGHVVVFGTATSFHRTVEGSGFRVVSAGFDRERDGSDERFARLQGELETVSPEGPARTLFRIRSLFAGLYAEWMVRDLLAFAADWKPDVIVREVAQFGGCIAAEVLGIPHASVRSNTMLSSDSARHLVAEQMTGLREVYNLEPDPDAEMLFRYLHLAFEPSGFSDPAQPPIRTAHLLRPVSFSDSREEVLPTWVRRLPGPSDGLRDARHGFQCARRDCSRRSSRDCARNRSTRFSPSAETATPATSDCNPTMSTSSATSAEPLLPTAPRDDTCRFSTVAATLSHGLPMVTIPSTQTSQSTHNAALNSASPNDRLRAPNTGIDSRIGTHGARQPFLPAKRGTDTRPDRGTTRPRPRRRHPGTARNQKQPITAA